MPALNRPLLAVAPLCALSVSLTPPAEAQTTAELEPVVVTGRKSPDQSTLTQPDLPTARNRIEQAAGGVGIIDAQSFTAGRVSTLDDALRQAAGVFVQPRFGAEEARVSIRGSGLQRTFHGRGIKLMQDGVPLNLADGSFDFQAIEALSARYVEVWRGANALQYGASNLGGAVNFVSPNGYNSDRFRLRGEAGSWGYRRALASAGDVNGAFDYYLSTSLYQLGGFRDHAHQDTRRSFANLGYQITPQLETRFYLGYADSDSELPGSITQAQLRSDPRAANAANVSGDQHRDIRWTRVSNKTVYLDGNQRFELFTRWAGKDLHHPIFQVIDQTNRDWGLEARYVRNDVWAGHRNRWTLGLAPSYGGTDEDRYLNLAGNSGARTNRSRQTARNLEWYAEDQFHLLQDVALIAGVQGVRATRELHDLYVAGTPSDPVSESFSQRYHGTQPKLGLRYDWQPQLQVFANVSRSFEPPSFGELAGGLRPTLNRAQRGSTLEVGSRGQINDTPGGSRSWLGPVHWDVALYEARLSDELLQVATNTAGASVTVNATRTLHRGLELGGSGEAWATTAGHAEWRFNALISDFRFRNDPVYTDKQLPGLPRSYLQAQLGWRFAGNALIAATAQAASGYPIDFTNSLRASGYTAWGLKASGDIGTGLSWFVDGRNLGNRKYAASTGILRDAKGLDSAQFFPGDGRSVFAGIDWRIN